MDYGASDLTSILYYVTTKLDIAIMYGHNCGSYDLYEDDKKSRTKEGYNLDTAVVFENIFGDVDTTGRIIGGGFNNTKAILVGRVMYPNEEFSITCQDVLKKAFDGMAIPVVFNMDIGHVVPKMSINNGAICHVRSKDGKGSLEFEFR